MTLNLTPCLALQALMDDCDRFIEEQQRYRGIREQVWLTAWSHPSHTPATHSGHT